MLTRVALRRIATATSSGVRHKSCPTTRNPAFTLPVYPPLDPHNPQTKAQHGVLGQLDGTWVNVPGVYGVHTTILPAPGSTSEQMFGTFHFKTDQYTETLEFDKNDGAVRNRLGSNEQFNGALNYKTSILDRKGAEIHFEAGQYIWLGVWTHQGAEPYSDPPCLYSRQTTEEDVKNDFLFPVLPAGSEGNQFIPPYSISRQGSIPHGNAIQLMGAQPLDSNGIPHSNIEGPPKIASLWEGGRLAFNKTMGYSAKQLREATNNKRVKPDFATFPIFQGPEPNGGFPKGTLDPNSGEAYMQRVFNGAQTLSDGTVDELFPYCVQPSLALKDANKGLDIVSHDTFTLTTKQKTGHQGGSLNNVGVERYAKVSDMRLDMWISKVKDPETGQVFDQLQYEQRVHFEFQFGVNGTVTKWPHIQVNTLRRKEDVEACN